MASSDDPSVSKLKADPESARPLRPNGAAYEGEYSMYCIERCVFFL